VATGPLADEVEKGAAAAARPVRRARTDAERGRGWMAAVARAGIVAKGVSYGLVGALAVLLAAGSSGKTTSREGALATLAQEPLGKVTIGLLAAGFAGFAAWQLTKTILGPSDCDGLECWAKRAACLGRAAIYVALTFVAWRILLGARAGSQTQEARENTAAVLSWPGGRWIVAGVGLAILAAGAWNVYRGVGKKFMEAWRMGAMSRAARSWGARAGVVGHVARGVVFGLLGIFLAKAALEFDPREAVGLDGALQEVARATYGRYALGVVASGLVCYTLFCLVDARYRDVSATAGDE
jgi:Domain of Unknown Function (DUF1206)